MNKFKKILLITATLFSVQSSFATHLVGGFITYECAGGNEYMINLRVYKDCGATVTGTFDDTAFVAIYNINGDTVSRLRLPKGPTVSIPTNSTGNPCLTPPAGLCTEYAEYQGQVILPPILGGYTLTHQRCCRNNSIDNISNPWSYGNTYTIQIPSLDSICNSSPQFQSAAPIVLCANDPLNLQLDAIDPDGDSLHFQFCEILAGGGQQGGGGCNAVIPNPPCPPPYASITLIAPSTAQNPLPGSASPITIDASNGTLLGTPDATGQYVVGVCVTEYRGGIPLSTARLDYQFNIVNCISNIIADMLTSTEDPTILCDGKTVQFQNQSSNFNHLRWDFGVPGISTDTSNLPNPVFIYADTGLYTVTLIVNPGWQCSDSTTFDFRIQDAVSVSTSWTGIPCFEVQQIQWEALGNFRDSTSFQWDFGSNSNISGWNALSPPPVTWTTPGWKYVTFSANWPPGCQVVIQDSIQISSLSANVDAGPDQTIASGSSTALTATGGSEYFWYSDHPARYSGRFEPTIFVRPERDTTMFYVVVKDELGCEGIDSVFVYLLPEIIEDPLVQNFISPNGDGRNDCLDLSNILEVENAQLIVLNRWGKMVFESSPYANDWSGQDQAGAELPDGTYYILLKGKEEFIYKGSVTLIRAR